MGLSIFSFRHCVTVITSTPYGVPSNPQSLSGQSPGALVYIAARGVKGPVHGALIRTITTIDYYEFKARSQPANNSLLPSSPPVPSLPLPPRIAPWRGSRSEYDRQLGSCPDILPCGHAPPLSSPYPHVGKQKLKRAQRSEYRQIHNKPCCVVIQGTCNAPAYARYICSKVFFLFSLGN